MKYKRYCSWCSKIIKNQDKTMTKNGEVMHSECFDENLDSNNWLIKQGQE